MKQIQRFRRHHEKSLSILDMIESSEKKIQAASEHYEMMKRMFGTWMGRVRDLDNIHFLKSVRQRLLNYYATHETKHSAMVELGQTIQSAVA